MFRLLGLLVGLVLLAAPLAAKDVSYPDLVREMGCQAPVYTSAQESPLNSFYLGFDVQDIYGNVWKRGLYLGTDPSFPSELGVIVVLHETAHCLQHQALGWQFEQLYAIAPQVFELDADRQSADMACQLGLDGPRLLTRLLQLVHDAYGYDGDPAHGSLNERMSMSASAPACYPPMTQSPLLEIN